MELGRSAAESLYVTSYITWGALVFMARNNEDFKQDNDMIDCFQDDPQLLDED